ncbi:DUF5813 family protein [Natranaeroarchaeum sulfidigenes]|uniref:Uncharacterized protein n=1 Tax=Natranaeroarchaeum sulfidigenes TaxID=2784880 RepID=A0A897MTD7_9EURY|nr:DUF5813 family protein [Natranaeroarchaeum sulfidigenes]QSG01485.1 Uncharacterized protein AArcS_0250 [Natranaeroarchaeum sulfidigenes]
MTTDEIPEPARRALDRHDAFEPTADGYECTTTPFDADVRARSAEGERDAVFEIEVRVPTLDAVVTDQTVGTAVADGWFDTLERRLADAYHAADVSDTDEPTIERESETVTATFGLRAWNASRGVDAAKAVIDFTEGTYVQGVIPGYEYGEPVAGLLKRAQQNGSADDAARGGMPL